MLRLSVAVVCLLSFTLLASAGKYNPTLSINDRAPEWHELPGTDGKKHSSKDLRKDIVVVVFTCNSCPYAVDYEDRLVALANNNRDKVDFIAFNVNKVPEDSLEKMRERAKAKKFSFPYVFDASQKIARDFGATYTPEFFVLDKQRRIVYMGAMDDNTDPAKVKRNYVQEAIDALKTGNEISVKETVAIGCRVRYERTRRSRRTRSRSPSTSKD